MLALYTDAAAGGGYSVSVVATCVLDALQGVWVMARGHALPPDVPPARVRAALAAAGLNATALDLLDVPQAACGW